MAGFTKLSAKLPPQEMVTLLNEIFGAFDTLVEKHGLEKIRTIGDTIWSPPDYQRLGRITLLRLSN
jgi:class 3 adenylate cyclase